MIITTGTITAVNGATLPLVYSDATGDHVESTVSGLVAGSRVQIYNVTTATEVVNEVVAGTSLSYYHLQTGATYRIRATKKGYVRFLTTAISGASGFNVLASQTTFSLYAQFNTDGATITEFAWDGVNLEVDITDSNNETIIQRIAAWSNYFETTEAGIRDFFGAITWEFYNQVKIDASVANIKLDNKKTDALLLEGGRLYRTDGQSIISSSTTGPIHVVGGVGSATGSGSASIALDYDSGLTVSARVYTMAGATQGASVSMSDNGSGLYTGTFSLTGVPDGQYIVRFTAGSMKIGVGSLFVRGENEVSQEDFFNPNFDIVQSVSSTTTNLDMLTTAQVNAEVDTALADYDAPTKAELDAVQVALVSEHDATQAQITALNNLSLAQVEGSTIIAKEATVATKLDASAYTAPDNAGITSANSKLDLIETKAQADARQVILVAEHDATQSALAGLNNLSLAQIEASTILAKEATVATKLDASAYTAPDNAGITAIKAKTDNLPAIPASQGDITALNNLSLAQVEGSTVLAKEATSQSILTDTNELQLNQGNWITATGFATPADTNAIKAVVDVLETESSASARQSALIAEHDATQAAIGALNNLSLAQIEGSPVLSNILAGTTAIDLRLPSDPADQSLVEAAIYSIASAPSTADIRAELATELARIDVATSTRMAEASYTAPDNAGVQQALAQATLARKHLTNRDKIDITAKTLTRYDDDGATALVTFDLKDSAGSASVTSIFEKDPQ